MKIRNGVLIELDSEDIKDGKIVIPSKVKKIGNLSESFLSDYNIREIEIEEGVESIADSAFWGVITLEKVTFPKSLKVIGKNAFENCSNLRDVDFLNVEKIGSEAFMNTGLEKVHLPSSIKQINEAVFQGCHSITEANVEIAQEEIPKDLFLNCSRLKSVKLAKNIKKIGDNAFEYCKELTDIDLSNIEEIGSYSFYQLLEGELKLDKVKKIGEYAFYESGISSVKLPDHMQFIGDCAFAFSNLKTISFPKSVDEFGSGIFKVCEDLTEANLNGTSILPKGAFLSCSALTNIRNYENLKTIEEDCFVSCLGLTDVDFTQNVEFVQKGAFVGCQNLRSIKLTRVKELGQEVFEDCKSLKDVQLSPECEKIGDSCFSSCKGIKSIELPRSLKQIGVWAFRETGIEQITLPREAVCNEEVFKECPNLKIANIQSKQINLEAFIECPKLRFIKVAPDTELTGNLSSINNKFKTIQKGKAGFLISSKSLRRNGYDQLEKIKDYNGLNPVCIHILWDNRNKLKKEVQKTKLRDFYSRMSEKLPEIMSYEQVKNFFKTANLTFYKKIPILNLVDKDINIPVREVVENFCDLLYDLGAFLPPQKEKRISKSGKEIEVNVNYAQRVGEFFIMQLENKNLRLLKLVEHCGGMHLDGLKPEFTKFFIEPENFEAMLNEEVNNPGFIAMCYNNFDEIQKTNTSNRGGQRQLKPTFKKFKEFYREEKFSGITDETADIADAIWPYFSTQRVFDDAVEIDQERRDKNVPDDILRNPVQEEDVFKYINEYSHRIKSMSSKATKVLTDLSDTSYVTEWLKKSDPKNFILGKLCDCCAHIEGAGHGIMHASIVDPDVQNLVVKNSAGQIVAKSTLYVNREKGYGVFNNVEVRHDVSEKDLIKIHRKYKLAAAVFAKKYNEENPTKPLTKLTVGMGHNDLGEVIVKEDEVSDRIYDAIQYSSYGGRWDGDSRDSQYAIWEKEENKD